VAIVGINNTPELHMTQQGTVSQQGVLGWENQAAQHSTAVQPTCAQQRQQERRGACRQQLRVQPPAQTQAQPRGKGGSSDEADNGHKPGGDGVSKGLRVIVFWRENATAEAAAGKR
jgi:hypothetical protein